MPGERPPIDREPGPTARLVVEYDGTRFAGWAAQPGRRTVVAELTAALCVVLRAPVTLTAAGRTDRGVHALGQVVSYRGEPPRLKSVNALLPGDVSVLAAERAPDGFSARHDARSRSYLYRLLARPAPSPLRAHATLHWPAPLDAGALHACAAALVGPHDFTAFTPTDTLHRHFQRRVLAASWTPEGDELVFRIEADAFMRQMNRVLVGTMLEVASGRRTVEDFAALLRGAPRSHAGRTAPPHGLHLAGARYGPEWAVG